MGLELVMGAGLGNGLDGGDVGLGPLDSGLFGGFGLAIISYGGGLEEASFGFSGIYGGVGTKVTEGDGADGVMVFGFVG